MQYKIHIASPYIQRINFIKHNLNYEDVTVDEVDQVDQVDEDVLVDEVDEVDAVDEVDEDVPVDEVDQSLENHNFVKINLDFHP